MAVLSGAFSDQTTIYEENPHLVHASCLPTGRNSALFRQQPLGCPTI